MNTNCSQPCTVYSQQVHFDLVLFFYLNRWCFILNIEIRTTMNYIFVTISKIMFPCHVLICSVVNILMILIVNSLPQNENFYSDLISLKPNYPGSSNRRIKKKDTIAFPGESIEQISTRPSDESMNQNVNLGLRSNPHFVTIDFTDFQYCKASSNVGSFVDEVALDNSNPEKENSPPTIDKDLAFLENVDPGPILRDPCGPGKDLACYLTLLAMAGGVWTNQRRCYWRTLYSTCNRPGDSG